MSTPTIEITANDYNTLFVAMGDIDLAVSSTMRRQRGFYNKVTGEYVDAPGFTPRKVRENPALVVEFLAATGTLVAASVAINY